MFIMLSIYSVFDNSCSGIFSQMLGILSSMSMVSWWLNKERKGVIVSFMIGRQWLSGFCSGFTRNIFLIRWFCTFSSMIKRTVSCTCINNGRTLSLVLMYRCGAWHAGINRILEYSWNSWPLMYRDRHIASPSWVILVSASKRDDLL